MITIAVVGPESTGKTTLTEALAAHYKTLWVPEYSREFLTNLNRPYIQNDLIAIAEGQLREERKYRKQVKDLLFLDTDLFVIKIWSEFKYGHCDPWILQQLSMNQASYYLLTYYDVPYEEDPLRESPENRPELFDLYEKALKEYGVAYEVVQGSFQKRLETAIQKINSIL
ncbi:ATP-binding protein [Roseivirga sp. UBA838]|uniref:ATP-binding protein n=1 Tax=Roseivirga sp. UBA838 TaxID=1947393 RepID=UPI00257993B0|nr:ATP-binding protein [Roseivirga sp. UBA838]|tara:strand:+ start:44191 stop:44700 length:510 start_codon:yes stop_codon:yes gene_type:complete